MSRTTFYSFLALLLLVTPLGACNASFYRDLKVGDAGEDVRLLQQVLNSRQQTRVAEVGSGAPGQETSYFGDKTRAAVMRYQELFFSIVLTPLGLSRGTGYVGPATRSLLNIEGASLPAPAISSPQAAARPATIDEANFKGTPVVSSLERAFADESWTITIHGSGFTKTNNEIHTSRGNFDDIDSLDGTTLSFSIKNTGASLGAGVVDSALFVRNKNGTSELVFFALGW